MAISIGMTIAIAIRVAVAVGMTIAVESTAGMAILLLITCLNGFEDSATEDLSDVDSAIRFHG